MRLPISSSVVLALCVVHYWEEEHCRQHESVPLQHNPAAPCYTLTLGIPRGVLVRHQGKHGHKSRLHEDSN